jgi:molybdenum cofactor synthesis domain-containing protein
MEIRFGILTISDRSSRGERADISGPALARVVAENGWQVIQQAVVPDDFHLIRDTLAAWADQGEAGSSAVDVILTTGGTGFSPRDVTPEATQAVIERSVPGLAEAMRAASLRITPHAMLSRAATGIRRQTLIVNLPGSPKGAVENLEVILPVLPHAVLMIRDNPDYEAGHADIPPLTSGEGQG